MKKKLRFEDLAQVGWTFDLEFYLPPFDGYVDECFFDIDTFKETEEFQTFIGIINETKMPYEYAKAKGSDKIYLTIKTGDLNGFHKLSKRSYKG